LKDATVADSSIGLEITVAAVSGVQSVQSIPASSAAGARSTVLPRVELVGETPRLVQQEKPRYEALRSLGRGGLGEVVGARDNDIGRDVAVKRLRPDVASPGTLARFVEEVRTIGRLEHPNIIPIHDVGVDERGEYYFVMKYVDGETLESIIDKLAEGDPTYHARYGFERRVAIFTALLEAVAFAHARGIVHRDIKPANVMVGAYGEVVLMDWGIAKRVRGEAEIQPGPASGPLAPVDTPKRGALFATIAGQIIGTPAYMSPEQARGEPVDERSDLYSLCMLFHELLCLRHPLAEKRTLEEMLHGVVNEATPMAGLVSSPHQPPTPMDLSWFVRKGLAKHPANRYASAQEMIDVLARRAEGEIPIRCHVTFMRRMTLGATRFVDRHPLLASLAFFAVVLGLVGGAVVEVVHALG
jgi:serine/threonine-protein kinase